MVAVLGLMHYGVAAASYTVISHMGDVLWLPGPIAALLFGFPAIFVVVAVRDGGLYPTWVEYSILLANSALWAMAIGLVYRRRLTRRGSRSS